MTQYSAPVTVPTATVALPAIDPGARAAVVPLLLGIPRQSVTVAVDQLPPSQRLGPIGTIFLDNTVNAVATQVTFPDTGALYDVPANSACYILAVTGGQRFTVSSPVTVDTAVVLQVLNRVVPPTGVQPIAGSIIINTGTVSVANPGPIAGVPVSRSVAVAAGGSHLLAAANGQRKYLAIQMPPETDGWLNFLGGTAGAEATDCFYLPASGRWESGGYVTAAAVNVSLSNAGTITAIEG